MFLAYPLSKATLAERVDETTRLQGLIHELEARVAGQMEYEEVMKEVVEDKEKELRKLGNVVREQRVKLAELNELDEKLQQLEENDEMVLEVLTHSLPCGVMSRSPDGDLSCPSSPGSPLIVCCWPAVGGKAPTCGWQADSR